MTVPTIAHSAADSASGGDRAVAIPSSGVAAGDVAFVVGNLQSTATSLTAPAGWTLVEDSTDTKTLQVWRRTLVSGDLGTSYTWTVNPGYYSAKLAIVIVSGADGTNPVNVLGSVASTAWGTTLTLTGPTSTTNDCLLLGFAAGADHGGSAAWSVTSGSYSEQIDSSGTYSSVLIVSKSHASAGAAADCGLSFSSAWSGGILAGVLLAVAPTGTPGTVEGSASAALGALTGSAVGPGASTVGRDPFLWPFAQTSVWNLPVGTGVTYESPGSTITYAFRNVTATPWLNCGDHSHPFYRATYDDPYATIVDVDHGNAVHYAYIPASAQIAPGTDKHLHVLQPDGETIIEMWLVTRNSSTSYTSYRVEYSDATGSGIGPDAGTRAYGGSAVGGLIRRWEVDPTDPDYTDGVIRHALALAITATMFKYTGGTAGYDSNGYGTSLGYVWPATEQDWDAQYVYTGVIPMGTFFIIPKTVNLSALGLSAAGYSVAKAMQDYGGYITDRVGGTIAWYAEPSVNGTAWFNQLLNAPNWNAPDLNTIRSLMVAVTNSTASTPAGGGTYSPLASAITGATTIQGLMTADLGGLTGAAAGTVTGLTESMSADLGTLGGSADMTVFGGSAAADLGTLTGSATGPSGAEPEPIGAALWGPILDGGTRAVTLYVEAAFGVLDDNYQPNAVGVGTVGDIEVQAGIRWTDITDRLVVATIGARFERSTQGFTGWSATLKLRNDDGDLSRHNSQSPYYLAGIGSTIKAGNPLRIRATYDNGSSARDFDVFTGYIEAWNPSYDAAGFDSTIICTAADDFTRLSGSDGYEQTPAGAGETTGARVTRVLDNAGHTGARSIATGKHTVQATTLAQNALTEAKLTADSEGGFFYSDQSGRLIFRDRDALAEDDSATTVQVVFADDDSTGSVRYAADGVEPRYDDALLVTDAAFARVGGIAQVATSSRARAQARRIVRQTRTDLVCETDEQAYALAQRALALRQEVRERVDGIRIDPDAQFGVDGAMDAALQAEAWEAISSGRLGLLNLVQVIYTPVQPDDDTIDSFDDLEHVRGVKYTITPISWVIEPEFSSAEVWVAASASRVGVGAIGSMVVWTA